MRLARRAVTLDAGSRATAARLPGMTVLLAIFAFLGGCQHKEPDAVSLTFWALGHEGELVQQLTREFERSHPNVRVAVQQIPWNAAHEKLVTGFVGETTPDVAQLGNTWVPEFQALGALEPLDRWVAGSQRVRAADFFPGVWATNVVGDTLYGLPWYVDTRVMFYRRDLAHRAGIESPPKTWAEWRVAMRRLQALPIHGEHYAIYLPLSEWAQPVIFGLQAGSSLLAENGTRGAFSEPAFRSAFEFYVSLFSEGLAPALGAQQLTNVYQEFARGYMAEYITGPWNLGEFANRVPADMQDAWATAPLPGPTGESSGVSIAGGASLVLFRRSPHKREAWQLVEFLSRPEQQARFYRMSGDLPPTFAAWKDSSLASSERARAFYVQLQRVRPLPPVPEWEQIATKVFEHAERVIRGAATVDQGLAALDRDVDQILEKRRWMLARQAQRARTVAGGTSGAR